MKNLQKILCLSFFVSACSQPCPDRGTEIVNQTKDSPPRTVVDTIVSSFPGSVPYEEGMDSLLAHLRQFGISDSVLLWGQSTCVDDITNTKNRFLPEVKGPFN